MNILLLLNIRENSTFDFIYFSGGLASILLPLFNPFISLTVEKGKVVLAEFSYDGKLDSTLNWDSTKSRRTAWFLKKYFFPWIDWNCLLKGREWLIKCNSVN